MCAKSGTRRMEKVQIYPKLRHWHSSPLMSKFFFSMTSSTEMHFYHLTQNYTKVFVTNVFFCLFCLWLFLICSHEPTDSYLLSLLYWHVFQLKHIFCCKESKSHQQDGCVYKLHISCQDADMMSCGRRCWPCSISKSKLLMFACRYEVKRVI